MNTRVCNTCDVDKDLYDYPSVRTQRGTYYRRTCKPCWRVMRLIQKHSRTTNGEHRYWQHVRETHDGTITVESLTKLFAEYDRCPYCWSDLTNENVSLDHMEPVWCGGKHTLSNVIPCCVCCNRGKKSKSFDEWFNSLRREIQGELMEDPRCNIGWAGI